MIIVAFNALRTMVFPQKARKTDQYRTPTLLYYVRDHYLHCMTCPSGLAMDDIMPCNANWNTCIYYNHDHQLCAMHMQASLLELGRGPSHSISCIKQSTLRPRSFRQSQFISRQAARDACSPQLPHPEPPQYRASTPTPYTAAYNPTG